MVGSHKLMHSVALAALVLACPMGASVQAADIEPMPVATPFDGFYVGGHIGYGSADYEGVVNTSRSDAYSQLRKFDNAGYLIGAHAGYNWRMEMSNIVGGIEGDITVAPWDAAWSGTGRGGNGIAGSYSVSGHLTGISSLRGRLGFVFDQTLLYATGGIAFASSNASGGETINHNKRNEIIVGPVAGGGLEWMVSPNISLRAEGLYYWFDQKQDGNGGEGYGGIQDTWMFRTGASWHIGNAGDGAADSPFVEGKAFSGFYVGGHTGYGSANYEGIAQVNSGPPLGDRIDINNAGYLIGAHAGYDWRMAVSNLVVGVEGDITVAPWDASISADQSNASAFVAGHLSGIASIRGRLGFVMERAMLYATGGIAFASSNGSGGYSMEFNNKPEIVVGPVAGGGIEWMVSPNMSLRAEGLHYWFDQEQGNINSEVVDKNDRNYGVGGIQNTWMVRAGASYHFDSASDEDPEVVAGDYNGFYVGGHTGYGEAQYEGKWESSATLQKFDHGGYLIGGHAGYNWQTISNIIAGVEGDISVTPWNAADRYDCCAQNVAGHLTGIASLRGRLGFAMDRSLIYATGGIAFASSNASSGYTVAFAEKTEIVHGPVAGGGFEWMATNNISLRAEGLYYWFDQKRVDPDPGYAGFSGIQDTWTVRVGASWHFN